MCVLRIFIFFGTIAQSTIFKNTTLVVQISNQIIILNFSILIHNNIVRLTNRITTLHYVTCKSKEYSKET
jgi:hypothetical protein